MSPTVRWKLIVAAFLSRLVLLLLLWRPFVKVGIVVVVVAFFIMVGVVVVAVLAAFCEGCCCCGSLFVKVGVVVVVMNQFCQH